MLYWPEPSVTTVRTFSMSTGLDASTVTPGSTAPDGSLTTPAIVPSCASAAQAPTAPPRRPTSLQNFASRSPCAPLRPIQAHRAIGPVSRSGTIAKFRTDENNFAMAGEVYARRPEAVKERRSYPRPVARVASGGPTDGSQGFGGRAKRGIRRARPPRAPRCGLGRAALLQAQQAQVGPGQEILRLVGEHALQLRRRPGRAPLPGEGGRQIAAGVAQQRVAFERPLVGGTGPSRRPVLAISRPTLKCVRGRPRRGGPAGSRIRPPDSGRARSGTWPICASTW